MVELEDHGLARNDGQADRIVRAIVPLDALERHPASGRMEIRLLERIVLENH